MIHIADLKDTYIINPIITSYIEKCLILITDYVMNSIKCNKLNFLLHL